MRFQFSINIFNLFDEKNVQNIFPNYLGTGQVVQYKDLNDLLKSNGD